MGQKRGRKPKPLAILKLTGNPGKRKMPYDTPQPTKLNCIPDAPAHLDEIGKEIWVHLAGELVNSGILTEIDVFALENCCVSLSIARRAAKEMQDNKLVYARKDEDGNIKDIKKTPYLAVYTEALSVFDSNGAKLGLSPSDRVRLKGVGTGEKKNPLEEYLSAKTN